MLQSFRRVLFFEVEFGFISAIFLNSGYVGAKVYGRASSACTVLNHLILGTAMVYPIYFSRLH